MPIGVIPEITLSMRLRIAREHAGLEQSQLSELSGVSRATISAAENGHRAPSKSTLTLIAMACGVDRNWLIHGTTRTPGPGGPGVVVPLLRLDSNQQPSGFRNRPINRRSNIVQMPTPRVDRDKAA